MFPWSLRFEPLLAFNGDKISFTEYLASIPTGSTLFNVFATDKPNGTETKIATIETTSETTTSNWADEHLFFRHQRMDDDLKYRPEWLPSVPEYKGILGNNLDELEALDCTEADLLEWQRRGEME